MTITVDSLKKMHTRALLKALWKECVSDEQYQKYRRECLDRCEPIEYASKDDYYKKHTVASTSFGYYEEQRIVSKVTVADLKAELALREHVPNKQESKVLRREKQRRNSQKDRGGKGRR
jgi:hypothetical protein